MNLRTVAVQLFLLATAAPTASAFVVPSATFTKSVSKATRAAFSPAHCPRALRVTDKLLDDLEVLTKDIDDGDINDPEKNIKLVEGLIKALESIDHPESTILTATPLVEQSISRKSVSMEADAAKITDSDITEYKDSDEDSKQIIEPAINLLKTLVKEWGYYGVTGKLKYATYPRHEEFPDVDLSWMMKRLDGPPPPEYIFKIPKIKRLIKRILAFRVGMKLTGIRAKFASPEHMFTSYFTKFSNLVPKPRRLIKTWEDDKEQARQFLAGVNPVMICVAKDLSQLSTNIVLKFGEDELQKLIGEKRLFYVSYDALSDLEVNPHEGHPAVYNPGEPQKDPRPFYAPIAVFELDSNDELDIKGIQLERTDDAKVYTSDDNNDEWLMAKCHLATSDSNIHEWVSHLGKTHLTMEPHIIAIHNTLKLENHPLFTFFRPLIKDTLLLNWAARDSLGKFGADAFGDKQSSIGVGQFMQINNNWWKTYDFFESSSLPQELASRGFDEDFKMPAYLFREDGLKLWDAYGTFASDFVDELYATDDDVSKDKVVQEWAEETTSFDRGAVPGFPTSIRDKATLVKVMQVLMWIPSGLHAAVNFPQYDYYAFAPNKPLYMRKKLSPTFPTDREDIFENALPTKLSVAEDSFPNGSIEMVNLLTLPSEACIDNLNRNYAEYGTKAYAKFQQKLDAIGDEIEKRNSRNKRKGNAVYSYLNPTVVPASIDI